MAAPAQHTMPIGPDTLITVKVVIDGNNRRFKLALRDLGAHVLPQKLRFLLAIPPDAPVVFERFSDSAGSYVTLDSNNPAIYKQLYRAAKAKLKLRLKATIESPVPQTSSTANISDGQSALLKEKIDHAARSQQETRHSYLETVLSSPPHLLNSEIPSYQPHPAYSRGSSSSNILSTAFGKMNINNDKPVATVKMEEQVAAETESLSRATLPSFHDFPAGHFCIDCNNCGQSIPNEHYHCSICESGDFDLCQSCVNRDVTCSGEEHWLIKRSIRGGMVVSSVTETIAPKQAKPKVISVEEMNEAIRGIGFQNETVSERTCNCCIRDLPSDNFVTCMNCPDFDLCLSCFSIGNHGHHPGHQFHPVSDNASKNISDRILGLCGVGRGVMHAAICDGCDKDIVGVRHKCLTCPDWDFCSACILSARVIHPGHRFAPLYEQIPDASTRTEIHCGIYCDGPLCAAKNHKSYIRGDRYKCAVCHDTDFCANCEAVPTHGHNRTHPLIKFKSPVMHVSVTTLGEDNNGGKMSLMGDFPRSRNASTETTPSVRQANAATQVQTVAEVKPFENSSNTENQKVDPVPKSKTTTTDLQAWFESDSTPDGTKFPPNTIVSNSWTLRNPGPQAWPAGCAVYYIGGDDMRNLDASHPSSVSEMMSATRSNALESPVEPGKTAVFKVLLKSPPREGRVISYWRLKTPEGLPFGHKLWVDITVTSTAMESVEEQAVTPTTTLPQESVPSAEDLEVKSQESSTMIFPKLEKESPVSSIHDVAEAATPSAEPAIPAEEEELFEDAESLALEDEETEDGFLTDEEYDILDASDEDFLMAAQKAVKK